MNPWLIAVLAFLVLNFALDLIGDLLNLSRLTPVLPGEFKGSYDPERYARSQHYLRENTSFGIVQSAVMFILTLGFLLLGGFNAADVFSRSLGLGPIPTGLVYCGVLFVIVFFLGIPWSAWHTFRIEEKYGFNRMTGKTFALDKVKGFLLTLVIGGLLLSVVLWFFGSAGRFAWFWAWLAFMAFQFIAVFLAPVLIMPLFNKFTPLPDGELKTAIAGYAASQKFRMKGVFTMDASKRSAKTNAFFTGLGKSRRIVLFDTLIQKLSVPEIVAVLAHETGHYKKGHIVRTLLFAAVESFLMFFLLSLLIGNKGLFEAFGMERTSVYASLVFFGFLYTPVSLVLKIAGNALSRAHETEADAFAGRTTGRPEDLVSGLKKLSVDNMSNLTPHPLKVVLEYGHPPVLERIRNLGRK